MAGYAVAAGHELTAEVAASILHDGGTAVDAAVAAAAMAMVAEPVLAGLLGGGFLMVRPSAGKPLLLDFFVDAPRRAIPPEDQDFRSILAQFDTATQEFHIGTGTIATPGVAPGLAEAHARFGRIPIRALMAPAVEAARAGVVVTDYQAQLARIVEAILTATPASRALWCEGEALRAVGAVSRNPELADVLATFAIEGPRFVTQGEVGQALLEVCREGGHLTADDLARYDPVWRTPLTRSSGPASVALNPPPALGGALIGFGLAISPHKPDAADMTRVLEATMAARIDAQLDADPIGAAGRLNDPDLLKRYRDEISRHARATRGTTHISVIDSDGMGAALTLSNGEGCGHILPGTGIMPNNMLGEDDLMPDGPHSWTPGQRLSSMMCPMVAEWPDGRFAMLGSGGSNRIRSALLQVLTGLVDYDQGLEEAIRAPRIHVDTGAEPGAPPAVDFEDLGAGQFRDTIMESWPGARAWPEPSMFFGGVHAAMREARGGMQAAGDARRAGASRVQTG